MSLQQGARNAVRVCMGIGASDRVVIVSDKPRASIGRALAEECEGVSAEPRLLIMEDFTKRPARAYPDEMAQDVEAFQPTASFFAAVAKDGELAFRRPYMDHVIYQLKVRHGHMVNIDERLMEEGMTADYEEISRITHRVNDAVKGSREIEVTSPQGTDLRARFDLSKLRWHPCPGIYREPGEWGNLPEGETFTSPATVEGVLAGEVLGDHFSEEYGVLEDPVVFEISAGRARKIETPDEKLRDELADYFSQHENSNRVGEFAIGTNVALEELTGNLLQDEKIPGVHLAFGYPYPEETGANWTCPSHLDAVSPRATIKVDGQPLMVDGRFLI